MNKRQYKKKQLTIKRNYYKELFKDAEEYNYDTSEYNKLPYKRALQLLKYRNKRYFKDIHIYMDYLTD